MRLETERLVIRKYSPEDADDYFLLKSCADVWRFSTDAPKTEPQAAKDELARLLEAQAQTGIGFCAVTIKSSGEFIGEAGILSINKNANRCVIGYNLLPAFWHRGYATEISLALIRYAFDVLDLHRVEALAMQDNAASCRVLEKAGMIREGILMDFARKNGAYHNVCSYGLVRPDDGAK
jgi:ribosomal-protein-alanine N-acetyltransferase